MTPAAATPARSDAGTALAALDIGTNSFHLMVARVRGDGYEVVTREKEMVRLGHGGGDMKELSPAAMDRGVAALRRMHRIAASYDAPLRAVATSAVREARNAAVFLERARLEADVEVEVISGIEEARLIHLGVLQSIPAYDRRLLLVDIGGGSTEVLVGEQGETLAARSFKLGAVRLTDRYFPGGEVRPGAVKACRSYVRSTLAGFERDVAELGFEIAIGSSGTAETVAQLVLAARGDPEPRTFNLFEHTRAELDQVVVQLVGKTTTAARTSVKGLEAHRADIIVAGAIVLQGVCQAFGIERLTFSDGALREGVLLDTIARHQGGGMHHLRDVSRSSIAALAERCDPDVAHSRHVAALALRLYDATQDLHRLPRDCRDYLEAAALLANVGLVISHSKHHVHSYYVVRNSDLLGLTDAEIEMIAQIARYHRKSGPKASHPEFVALTLEDQRIVRTLSGLLRVAIGLDRTHDCRVRDVRVERTAKRLSIEAVTAPGVDVSLETWTAQERSALLAEVLGFPVAVVAATS